MKFRLPKFPAFRVRVGEGQRIPRGYLIGTLDIDRHQSVAYWAPVAIVVKVLAAAWWKLFLWSAKPTGLDQIRQESFISGREEGFRDGLRAGEARALRVRVDAYAPDAVFEKVFGEAIASKFRTPPGGGD